MAARGVGWSWFRLGWLGALLLARASWAAEVPPGFVAETLATDLNAATAIAPAPDGRILIADQTGFLRIWKDGRLLDPPALSLPVADYWERGLIGVALDPQFPKVPHVYVLYVAERPAVRHVLSRFVLQGDQIDPASERVLLEGDDQSALGGSVPAGHQGGPLRFGADGFLYASIGENTAGAPAQRLDTLQGKILRLAADGSIPADNPFRGQATGKYQAIFARGVRNSFGIGAQSLQDGGRIFFTDVGGSAFEEINELVAGGNYGWPRAEGFSTNAAFIQPLHAYPPIVGQSVVGSLWIARSQTAWPEKWRGKLLFGDFMKHWIKALDPAAPAGLVTFARGLNGPVALELAPDGSLLVLNRGAIWRDPKKFVANCGSLIRIRYDGSAGPVPAAARSASPAFKAALGLPSDPHGLARQLSAAQWSARVAGARGRSFAVSFGEWEPLVEESSRIYLPHGGQAEIDPLGALRFPPGTVFVREFAGTVAGDAGVGGEPAPQRRIFERRFSVIGAPRGYGAAYRVDVQGDGELVEDGELTTLHHPESLAASRNWWIPAVDDALGEPVVNPSYRRLSAVAELGLSPAEGRRLLVALAGSEPANAAIDRRDAEGWNSARAAPELRVRLYLHANCSVCHQPGGASRGQFDARITTPLALAGMIYADPRAGDLGIAGAKLIYPGDPERSILFQRLQRTDFFRMPPVAYHSEPTPILPVLADWIRQLPLAP